jgi:hypothetical protein
MGRPLPYPAIKGIIGESTEGGKEGFPAQGSQQNWTQPLKSLWLLNWTETISATARPPAPKRH